MDTDKAVKSIGKYSRYQLIAYFLVSTVQYFSFAWGTIEVVFVGDTPNYRCEIGANDTVNTSIPTVTVQGAEHMSQCSMYREPGVSNETVPCRDGFWYDPQSGYDSTLVTEFDLTCGKSWMVELSITIMNIGLSVGSLFGSRFSDLFGRKKVMFVAWAAMVVCHTTQAFSTNMTMYMVLVFLQGAVLQVQQAAAQVYSIELFGTDQRTFAAMASELFWAAACMTLPLIAYFVRDWRHLTLCLSVPFVASLPLYWLISESIPWLLANKRHDEAIKVLKRIHKFNKTKFSEDLVVENAHKLDTATQRASTLADSDVVDRVPERKDLKNRQQLSVIDLFSSKKFALYTVVLMFEWFMSGLVYYSLTYTVTYLPGDRYLNSFLYGLTELPAYIICWIVIYYFGRVLPMCIYTVVCGVALIASTTTSLACCSDIWQLNVMFSMVAKFCISSTFAIVITSALEMFPTNLRSVGYGLCSAGTRVSVFISPFTRMIYRTIPWLTPVVLGVLSIIAGLLALLLPETRYANLPETIGEAERIRRVWSRKGEPREDKEENPHT